MDLFKTLHNPDAKVGSSAFDLSAKHVFSAKAGQCVPSYVIDTVPGDKFEIDLAALMRSNTMDTAAFVRGKFNFDFFFVPYQQVWHRFLDFVSQKNDLHTSYYKAQFAGYAPTVSLKQIIRLVVNAYITNGAYGRYYFGRAPYCDMLRLLDMLGYGNYLYLIKEADANNWTADSIDLINTLNSLFGGSTINDNGDFFVNIFRLLAYQHIWYDFYRNKYIDVESNYANLRYSQYFNVDDVDCSTLGSSRLYFSAAAADLGSDATNRILNILSLRYSQWKKDIYTSAMPSQQYGVVSSVDFIANQVKNLSPGGSPVAAVLASNSSGGLRGSNTAVGGQVPSNWSYYDLGIAGNFDVVSLRRAEALQKWKEAALRAGNMNDNNQKAHFGVSPYYYEDNEVHFIGSFDGAFQVNPVEATAKTGSGANQSPGDLAATGTAIANGKTLHFECRDYGILMCIQRFIPETEYPSNGLEKANSRFEPFDYYNPEFANIGLQAVPLVEQDLNEFIANKNYVLGYAPRDYDYKQKVDKVFGEFGNTLLYDGSRLNGNFANWVSPRRELLVEVPNSHIATQRRIDSYYIDAGIFNKVFGRAVDDSPVTDQFLFNAYFNVKAIRKMPVLGLPEF